MPYRIDVRASADDALDPLVNLGALDVDVADDGRLAVLMPDGIAPARVAAAVGAVDFDVSDAIGRDDGSVWVLRARPVRIGRLVIAPVGTNPAAATTLTLLDSAAFGTGLHATTTLCLEALQDAVDAVMPATVLDVGTGSGVLALAALALGVPRADAIDLDDDALRVAAENARLNGLTGRLQLTRGGPESTDGTWPLVLANVLAAPLIEMAPVLVRRLDHLGRLVLSGVPSSVEAEVDRAYRHVGLRHVRTTTREGWVAIELQASW